MPARSRAQAREMGYLYSKGKISRKTLEDFNKGIKMKNLPERVSKKSGGKTRRHRRGGRKSRK